MATQNPGLKQGAVLMVIAALAFIGYAVVFFVTNFTGTGFELGVETLNGVTRDEADEIARGRREKLEQELAAARGNECAPVANRDGVWRGYTGGPEPADESHTGVEAERLAALLRKLSEVPARFRLHPKLERGMKARRQMADGEHPLDWAAAEALAFATLATEGVRIRLSGQDSGRGTFSHRHAILCDQQDGRP